jgi:hypothetical protein
LAKTAVAQAVAVKAVNRVIVRKKMTNLDQAVIDLHNIARTIEQEIGIGKLSIECRRLADRLSDIINPIPVAEYQGKGDQ